MIDEDRPALPSRIVPASESDASERTRAAELDTRGTALRAAAISALLDSGMTAADVATIVGLDPRQVRDLAKHTPAPTT